MNANENDGNDKRRLRRKMIRLHRRVFRRDMGGTMRLKLGMGCYDTSEGFKERYWWKDGRYYEGTGSE